MYINNMYPSIKLIEGRNDYTSKLAMPKYVDYLEETLEKYPNPA